MFVSEKKFNTLWHTSTAVGLKKARLEKGKSLSFNKKGKRIYNFVDVCNNDYTA